MAPGVLAATVGDRFQSQDGFTVKESNRMSDTPMIFVLMPFDDEFDDVFEHLIKKPLEAMGYGVRRADSLFNQQQILKDVVRGIADAEVVIADVTGLNGNVLYELGLAHAMGKRTVMITQRLDELPFDLRPYRANEYSTRFNRADELSQLLTDIGRAVFDDSADFGNPVQDFAPSALGGQAQVAVSPQRTSARQPVEQVNEEGDDEPGMLEYTVALEQRSGDVIAAVRKVGELTEEVGTKFSHHSGRLERAKTRLGDRAAGAQLTIARDAARDLDAYSAALEPLIPAMEEPLAEVAAGMNSLARNAGINDEEDLQAAKSLLDALEQGESGMSEGRAGISSFARVLLEIPHMERNLTAASKKAARLVNDTAEVIETAESEYARARGLLQERVNAYERADS